MRLAAEFSQSQYQETVTSIELLNEPFPQNSDEVAYLRKFYELAYRAVRDASGAQPGLVLAIDAGTYRMHKRSLQD